jgi:hypothetical protein
MKIIIVFIIVVYTNCLNFKSLLFNTDYFFHEQDDIHFYNKTAKSSLTKSLVQLIILTPLSVYALGPTIALTPIGLTVVNSYIYYGSIEEINKIKRRTVKKRRGKKKKKKRKKFNFKQYYMNRMNFLKKIKELNKFQNRIGCGLTIGSCLLFFGLTFSIILRNKWFIVTFIILLVSFSFITSFLLTYYNENNKEIVRRSYLLNEYTVECLVGNTPTFESFIEDLYSNVRIIFGMRKRNFRGKQFKLNRKCLKMINEIGEIKISNLKIISIMFSTSIINVYRSFIDNLGHLEIIFFIFINTLLLIIFLIFCKFTIFVNFLSFFCISNSTSNSKCKEINNTK